MIEESPLKQGPQWTELVDLASERVGGAALWANDDFFASKDNLLKPTRPAFDPHAYTDRGKLMDGWESRRSFGRIPGHTHDSCIVKLGLPGFLRGVDVDTSWFRGNYPESVAIDACELDGDPELDAIQKASWFEVLSKSDLRGNDSNFLPITLHDRRATHLRLRIFPDGGVARFRAYGVVSPDWKRLLAMGTAIDLAAVECGGTVVAANDMFFGSRHNLIMPGRSVNMGDGWETRRKRREGHDWCIVQLGKRGFVKSVEVDTNHFKGNFPESCWLEGIDAEGVETDAVIASDAWFPLVRRQKLRAHTRHYYTDAVESRDRAVTHVRLSIHPDGGISRLRVHGVVA
ncbi:MAG: allantoicase [Polyangiales bacterium]